jgi:hypothetical protein
MNFWKKLVTAISSPPDGVARQTAPAAATSR